MNIARSLFHDEAFKDQPYTEREAFMWLVMEASWKDRTKRIGNVVVDLKRGQLAASIRFMAEAWDWEKSTVDRFLKRLEKRDMIGTECGTGTTVITIRKYNEYQGGDNSSGTDDFEKRDSSGTAAGQTRTPEETPEASLEQNTGRPTQLVLVAENDQPKPKTTDGFDRFWSAFPQKGRVAKKAAHEKYCRAVKSGVDAERIISAAEAYSRTDRVQRGFAMHATTWLNGGCWDDEAEAPPHHSRRNPPIHEEVFR
ncbi:MAG: hypothetical protein DI533_00345 [Cereibacter sphaeroides]|uniref:Uncharacterized protein n=1 Tax=Cereibacter sphaeroides TaxID=1063 RepID=A0A2W5SED4_CERSP|nr:MAG: hypothetical protein DI533_00345 [Cereibacter sphaeroides]